MNKRIEESALVTLCVGLRGGVVVRRPMTYSAATHVMGHMHNSEQKLTGLGIVLADGVSDSGEVVQTASAVWDWSEVVAIWVEGDDA